MCFNGNVVNLEGGVDCVAECVPLGDCKDWLFVVIVAMDCGEVSSIYFHAGTFGWWEGVLASSAEYNDACCW